MLNKAKLLAATTGFKATFQAGLSAAETMWSQLAMKTTSTTFEEQYGWLKETPGIREWLGDRQVKQLEAEAYRIPNRDWEETIGVDRNILKDDRYGIMAPRFEQMGRDVGQFPDELVFEMVRGGFERKCFDDQYFFDTDHPVTAKDGSTGTFANTDGGAASNFWMMIDDSQVVKPFIYQEREAFNFVSLDNPDDPNVFFKRQFLYGVDGRAGGGYGYWQTAWASKNTLNAANFETGLAAMGGFKGNNGKRLNIRPRKLWVPPALEGRGRDVVKAANNAAGASNIWQGALELVVCGWMTA